MVHGAVSGEEVQVVVALGVPDAASTGTSEDWTLSAMEEIQLVDIARTHWQGMVVVGSKVGLCLDGIV